MGIQRLKSWRTEDMRIMIRSKPCFTLSFGIWRYQKLWSYNIRIFLRVFSPGEPTLHIGSLSVFPGMQFLIYRMVTCVQFKKERSLPGCIWEGSLTLWP